MLFCAGRYINPEVEFANARVKSTRSRNGVLEVMNYMGAIEFLAQSQVALNLEEQYEHYRKWPFGDPVIISKEIFEKYPYGKLKKYERDFQKYKNHFHDDIHLIKPDQPIRGLFYYILTHYEEKEIWGPRLDEHNILLDESTKIVIGDLAKVKAKYKTCCENLKRKIGVLIDTDAYYVGVPLIVKDRPIGIIRILIKKTVDFKIPNSSSQYYFKQSGQIEEQVSSQTPIHYDFETADNVYEYITNIAGIKNIALIQGLHLNSLFYGNGMRRIALKDNLHEDFKNLNVVAD